MTDEAQRITLLHATRLLGGCGTAAFDALTRSAAALLHAPMAAINLVDTHQVWSLSCIGLRARQHARTTSCCDRVVQVRSSILVPDMRDASSPCPHKGPELGGQPIQAYAGAPLLVEGQVLGTLCVYDTVPRNWLSTERAALEDLAVSAAALVESQLTAQRFRLMASRMRTASLAGSDWLWETNARGEVQWVSVGLVQHTGLDPASEIGLKANEIYVPRSDETLASWQRLQLASKRHEPFSDAIADRITPRGRITVSISGTPVFNNEGQFMGYRGASRNVTRQLALEQEARRADLLLRQAIEAFQVGVMISAPNGRILLHNRWWLSHIQDWFEHPPVDWPDTIRVLYRQGAYAQTPLSEDAFVQWRLSLHEEESPQELSFREHWLLLKDHLLQDGSVVHFAMDITQKRLAVQALASSEERWKFALDGAGHGVWDWDLPSQKVFFSPQWKQLLGYADHELPNDIQTLFDLIHSDDTARVRHDLTLYLRTSQGIYQSEFRMWHKQGHTVSILSRGKVVSTDADGQALRLVGTHSDITLIKQAEQALREKQSAEAASTAKSAFLSRMSHEIRTPLNAVNGFAQLLQLKMSQSDADTGMLNYVTQIRQASLHLMGLVNDVLDLQQVETGMPSFKLETLSLTAELQQCADMLAPLAAGKDVVLESQIEQDWLITADAQRLRQIFMNIGTNAIKYNRQGGRVHFTVEARINGMIALNVEDTGPGMNSAQLARLYQPFERLGRETSGIEGTGLGLIITRSLLDAMGGHLDIQSQPGRGTCVSILLPQAAGAAHPSDQPTLVSPPHGTLHTMAMTQANDPAQERTSRTRPLRVLYVEDNRINAMLFEEALRPYEQIELDIAEDGLSAFSLARDKPPHVLVLDAHLPGMSGFDVLKGLRALPGLAQVPAYMCSADAMPEDVARAMSEGFAGYWTKPIDIVEVTAALCNLATNNDNPAP